ncbi:hypothetical protein BDQ12DRAFT_644760 [Crucibulum laeve]|uniref:Uncharacterized protein n=1 Tax=Crucibulum laeve TaxID=68775 RepID=A0A5C3MEM8_9AGAR|nr:hypothetical protein BDQ12DRAFT_644760 [Crucibulum laeve]
MHSILRFAFAYICSRRRQARVLSTIICTILVVTRPFSEHGGQSAFLALTVKELVFPVQDNLAQQVEITFLHLIGGLSGIAISALGKFLASLSSPGTAVSRFIPALFLITTCFLAGWGKSRLPRLTLASRIACFVAIWLLTWDIGTEQKRIRADCVKILWVISVAALTSLLSSMLLLRWSSTQFACDVAASFSKLHTCLSRNLHDATRHISKECPEVLQRLQKDLPKSTAALNFVYQQTSFELRVGRVDVKSLKPLIFIVEHLRRELSRKLIFPPPVSDTDSTKHKSLPALHAPALRLGNAILGAMQIVESVILACYDRPTSTCSQMGPFIDVKIRLSEAVCGAREELERMCNQLDMQQRSSNGRVGFPEEVIDTCSCMISLIQIAYEMRKAMHVAEDILVAYNNASLRMWYPRFSLAWLGVTPNTVPPDEDGTIIEEAAPDVTSPSVLEKMQGITEQTYDVSSTQKDYVKIVVKKPKMTGKPLSLQWWQSLVFLVWNNPRMMVARLTLDGTLRALHHSPHLHHAFKNAVGIAILGIPAFLPQDSSGHRWFMTSFGQWMLISYIWVLETNTGATWRVAYLRLSGTVAGALYAYVASLICRSNSYLLVIMITIADFPVSWIVTETTFTTLGTVASVTLPPILLTPYFQPGSRPTWIIATLRTGLISLGIVAALVTNTVFFPRHCRVVFLNNTCRMLGLSSQLYMTLSRDLFHHKQIPHARYRRQTYKIERDIQQVLYRMSALLKTMNDEFSLTPKPMQRYRQIYSVLRKLSDLLTALRKIREHIPRKETVTAVASYRREMVSCFCISLFSSEQVFRARQPLPQFLPSCRVAYYALERQVEERIRVSRHEGAEPLGLPMVYAFAEMRVLGEMVDTVEELLDVTRQLFGSLSWLCPSDSIDITTAWGMHGSVA